ncbi:hypothetical protein FOFC_00930 [Fusarium oxysporum]|nr:hypothetical protein FOFC_00930 [Fusarium oxysporum]
MAQTGSRTFKCSQRTPACPSIQGPQSAGPRPLLSESIGCHSTIFKVPILLAARQTWVSLFFSLKKRKACWRVHFCLFFHPSTWRSLAPVPFQARRSVG